MTNHKKKQCPTCLNEFTTRANNYEKHIAVCNGEYKPFKKLASCKYCHLEFTELSASQRANHSRWCDKNPKRSDYNKHLEVMRSSKVGTNNHNQFTKARALGLPIPEGTMKDKPGAFAGKHHTEETKQLLREKALASKHRRILRSTRSYIKTDGTVVLLDSSWEEALAIRLDSLGIDWVRPGPVKWIDDHGNSHNYFPDFYLTEQDIYLDPKNDVVYNITIEKINKITEVLPNLIILRTLDECKNFDINR